MRGIAFVLLATVLVLAPLPLGSFRPVSLGIVVILLAIACVFIGLRGVKTGDGTLYHDRLYLVPGLSLALLVVWHGVQLLSLPEGLVQTLSPFSHSVYADVLATGQDTHFHLSVDPEATARQMLLWLCLLLGFLAVFGIVRSSPQLMIVAWLLAGLVVLQAVAGIVFGVLGFSLVPEHYVDGHFSRARGSFVNANHFAAFVNLGVGLLLGAFIALAPMRDSRSTIKAVSVNHGLMVDIALAVSVLACLGAVVMSGSRGAVLGLAVSLPSVLVLQLLCKRRRGEVKRLAVVLGVGVLGVVVAAFVMDAGSRLTNLNGMSERLWMWNVALAAFFEQPLTGVGAGAFKWLPGLFSEGLHRNVSYIDAHNFYLEMLSEQGLIGFVLSMTFFISVAIVVIRGLGRQNDPLCVAVIYGALIGGGAVLVQSVFDFHLEAPANSLYLFVLLASAMIAGRINMRKLES